MIVAELLATPDNEAGFQKVSIRCVCVCQPVCMSLITSGPDDKVSDSLQHIDTYAIFTWLIGTEDFVANSKHVHMCEPAQGRV